MNRLGYYALVGTIAAVIIVALVMLILAYQDEAPTEEQHVYLPSPAIERVAL